MLSNIKNKLWCLIAIWFASWLLHIPCLAENISADQFLFYAESFDYSTPVGWGFPAMDDAENDIIGLTAAQRTDLAAYPEHWLKAWIRLYVQPSIHEATIPFCDLEDDTNPLSYSNLRFENIRICNMHELGVYPKSRMVFASTPSAFLDKPLNSDGDWWYMEVMIEKRDRTEEEITQALRQAEILCDAYVQHNDQYNIEADLLIDISAVERRILFDADSIEISAEQCKKSSVSAYDIFANYNVDEDLESEAQIHPEHFQCYALEFTLTNQSPYDILSLDYESVLCDDNAWLMYFDMEYRSIYGCKSGTSIPVSGYYLILRKPECGGSISEQAIDEMTIPITVHTEFAGILQNDETEGALGYDGIPFTVEIDMRHCQMDSKDLNN